MAESDEVVVKDFSRKRPRVVITLGGDEFEGKAALGLPTLQRVQQIQRRLKDPDSDRIEVFRDLFAVLLKEDSARRFMIRLDDEDDPVDADQLQGMVAFLMEYAGGRPTRGSSASPDGSSDAEPGTPSTDGVSPSA